MSEGGGVPELSHTKEPCERCQKKPGTYRCAWCRRAVCDRCYTMAFTDDERVFICRSCVENGRRPQ